MAQSVQLLPQLYIFASVCSEPSSAAEQLGSDGRAEGPACGITGGTCAFMGGLWEHQGTNQPPRAGAEAATHRSHSKAIKKTQRTCPCLFRAETSRCVPCPPARAAAQPQATRPPGAALPHGLRMDKGENGGGDGVGGCRCDARG